MFASIIVFTVAISVAFFRGDFSFAKEVSDVDALTGQRIGVMTAYESDYLLSDRSDITLKRYDSEADLMVALCYKQVDAISYIKEYGKYILKRTKGFEMVDGSLAQTGYALIYDKVRQQELADEFNEWLAVFMESDRYDEYCRKIDNIDFYDGSPITEETGTGKMIAVAYIYDYVPIVFADAKTGLPNGYETEIIRLFANDMNYKIEWVETTDSIVWNLLLAGKVDLYLGGYSELYRSEMDSSEYYGMSDNYYVTDIVLMKVSDYDNISLIDILED